VQAFVAWAFAPRGPGTFRAVLLVLTLALAAGAVSWRERRPRHAVQLANAGGIVTLALAATLLFPTVAFGALGRFGTGPVSAGADASFGWELWLLAVGFGLVAYSCVDRRPGAGYLGVAVLLAFAVLAGEHTGARGSLIGWPLFLLVLGGVGLAIGLRPRKELPPPPGSPIPAPTIPLHKIEGEGS